MAEVLSYEIRLAEIRAEHSVYKRNSRVIAVHSGLI